MVGYEPAQSRQCMEAGAARSVGPLRGSNAGDPRAEIAQAGGRYAVGVAPAEEPPGAVAARVLLPAEGSRLTACLPAAPLTVSASAQADTPSPTGALPTQPDIGSGSHPTKRKN